MQPSRWIIAAFVCLSLVSAERVKIKIVAPRAWNDRKAILLTREKGFAAVVHSIRLGFDTTHLTMDADMLPDLYQFQVSQKKGALTFFFDPGTEIRLDTANLARSVVTHSRSNEEWQEYQMQVQKLSPSTEREQLWNVTADFIATHPKSYVSLYLLKVNWYALKDRGLFEKLDPSLASHRNYRFLRDRNKAVVRK